MYKNNQHQGSSSSSGVNKEQIQHFIQFHTILDKKLFYSSFTLWNESHFHYNLRLEIGFFKSEGIRNQKWSDSRVPMDILTHKFFTNQQFYSDTHTLLQTFYNNWYISSKERFKKVLLKLYNVQSHKCM